MEKSLGEIKKYIKSINKNIDILKEKYQKDYTKISPYEYIWAVLSKGIVSRSEGLVEIIEKLEGEKIKKIASDTLRNILEEYFYLKVLTVEKNEAKKNLRAFTGLSSEKNKKHLNGILRMYKSGKAEPLTDDPNRLLSVEGLKNKIAEYDNILENLSEEEIKLKNIYAQVERLCQEYDTKKQVISTENGKEDKSLEWLYQIIYRYLSGSVHQRLEFKEGLVFGEEKEDLNHIMVTLPKILQETDSLYKF